MKWYLIFLALLASCSTFKSRTRIENEMEEVLRSKSGSVIYINLKTNNKIKNGKVCQLFLLTQGKRLAISLKDGLHAYGINTMYSGFQLEELNCGPFYYYKFEQTITAMNDPSNIVYLGNIDFELLEEGKLVWGREKDGQSVYKEQMEELGLPNDRTYLAPLQF